MGALSIHCRTELLRSSSITWICSVTAAAEFHGLVRKRICLAD